MQARRGGRVQSPSAGAPHGRPPIPSRGLGILEFPLTHLVLEEGERLHRDSPDGAQCGSGLLVICAMRVQEAQGREGAAQCSRGLRGAPNRNWAVQSSASPRASPSPAVKWGEALLPGGPSLQKQTCTEGTLLGQGSLGNPTMALSCVPRHCQETDWVSRDAKILLGTPPPKRAVLVLPGLGVWLPVARSRTGHHSTAPPLGPVTDPVPGWVPRFLSPQGPPSQSLPRAPFCPYCPQDPLGV